MFSASNDFNSNEMFSMTIFDDSSVRILINSTIRGSFHIKSVLFSGGNDTYFVQCETHTISKIINAKFNYQIDPFIGKIRLFVFFNLADDFDNLIQYTDYLAMKLTVTLTSDNFENSFILIPARNTSTKEFLFR